MFFYVINEVGPSKMSCKNGKVKKTKRANPLIMMIAFVDFFILMIHCPSFFDFSVAARTALITVARSLPFSRACRPSIVVPPGLVT